MEGTASLSMPELDVPLERQLLFCFLAALARRAAARDICVLSCSLHCHTGQIQSRRGGPDGVWQQL